MDQDKRLDHIQSEKNMVERNAVDLKLQAAMKSPVQVRKINTYFFSFIYIFIYISIPSYTTYFILIRNLCYNQTPGLNFYMSLFFLSYFSILVNCVWSSWSSWSSESGRCKQTRTKIIKEKHGGQCYGNGNGHFGNKNCHVKRCPTKG